MFFLSRSDFLGRKVPFELPEFEERYRMLTYYMSKYLLNAVGGKNAATIVVEGVEEEHIKEAAEVTIGFSGKFFFISCIS